ncbi:MAG: hypothetical protein QM780_17075 [Hyphomicrobium sp.]|uniref:hypothetical protein n=1 Tax=Hyphomicrobium sp. TaxID=82 RepID=UPI0039E64E4B
MKWVSGALVSVAAAVSLFGMTGNGAARACALAHGCAGMILAQNADPDDSAPDGNSAEPPSNTDPDNGSSDDNDQAPNDGAGDDDGAGSEQASPPEPAQPPGCIFDKRPLELLV